MTAPAEMQETLREFARCVTAFGEYRSSVVLTGGLVPFMYRHVPGLTAPEKFPPAQSFDLDWTVPNPLEERGTPLYKRLLAAGFVVILGGEPPLPVTQFQPARFGSVRGPIYIEFLTPRKGGATVRGRDRSVIEVQKGLTAQALPYLDLLLHKRIAFDISVVPGIGAKQGTEILLPKPMAFILQKTLARRSRRPHKQASDQAHIYDVAVLMRERWPQMNTALSDLRSAGFPDAWFIRALETLEHLYASPESDGPVEVARVLKGRTETGAVQARSIHRAMRQFLAALAARTPSSG